MKKALIILLSLIVLVIVALLTAPLFYPIDNLRPRIEAAANQKLRGEVKLGHLSFALFPTVKIGAEDVRLLERKGGDKPFGKIAKLEIRMSLLSLLSSPKATFRLDGLDMNLASTPEEDTLKNFLADAPTEATPPPAVDGNPLAGVQKQLSSVLVDVPGFVRDRILNARFSMELLDSHVSYKKVAKESSMNADLGGLKFQVLEIGFNSPIRVDASGVVNVTGKGLKVQGPFAVDGELTFTPSSGANSELKFKVTKKLDDLAISVAGLLDKKPGDALNAEASGTVKIGQVIDANVDALSFQFGGIKTSGSLAFKGEKLEGSTVDLKISSDKIDLAGLGTLVPLVRDYKLKGESHFRINVSGPTTNPSFDIGAHLGGVSGSTPQLAKPITGLRGDLAVTGNLEKPVVKLTDFSLKIGRSDLAMSMSSEGLEKIFAKVNVTSTLLDGDELMGVEGATGQPAPSKPTANGKQTPAADATASLDEVLDQMAPMVEKSLKNEMLDRITLNANMNVKKIRFTGAEYTNAVLDARLAGRKLSVKSGNMGAYGGHLQADMDLGLKPSALEYAMKAKMDKIQVGEAIKIHAPNWKNAMSGAMIGSMTISGKGLRKNQLAQNLQGKIDATMEDGRLSLPVMQLVTMFISKLPKQATEKLGDQEFRGDFKTMKFSADIVGRTVKIKEMNVVYDPKKAQIGDLRMSATGTLNFDKQINFDATAFVSPELVRVGELKGPSGQVEIPMKLSGTMEAPKPDIGYTMKILGERFAKGALKSQAQKLAPQVIDKLKQNAPEPVKKGLDDLKKRFGF